MAMKQSDLGEIPSDWELHLLGQLTDPNRPISYGIVQTGKLVPNGIPCLRVVDLENGKVLQRDLITTSKSISDAYKRTILRQGDLVTPLRGKVGEVAIVDNSLQGANITRGLALIALNREYSARFLKHALSAKQTRNRLQQSMNGSALQEISIATLRSFLIAIPPTLAEQEAIAGALSDADAWIESLEQLIAKKRQIKQGAMQELLTGKRRLPGFSGEWERKRLGEHCRFLRNGTNSRAELTVEGPLKYLHYGDIHSCKSVHIYPNQLPSLPVSKGNTLDRLQDGDLVLADASEDMVGISKSVEIIGSDGREVVAGLHTIAVRFFNGLFATGFVGFLQHCPDFNLHLRKLAAGTKVYASNRRHVASAEISIPPQEEQAAIAAVLSDMDADIESVESKLSKAREIKQGMMQELLTGRIRLI